MEQISHKKKFHHPSKGMLLRVGQFGLFGFVWDICGAERKDTGIQGCFRESVE